MPRLLVLAAGILALAVDAAGAVADGARILARDPHLPEIGNRAVAFMAREAGTGTTYLLEGSDVSTRHTPWSTFKVPNLLIGLETGAATSLEHMRTWNPERRPPAAYWPDDWRQDQTLMTAFRRSAVWYFQDMALEIGADRYRHMLSDWGYGNARLGEGSDRFWLDGSLRISVEEQVVFLDDLVSGRLGLSDDSIAALLEASRDEAWVGFTLYGKTGSGPSGEGQWFEGWYVGLVNSAAASTVVFALHVEAPSYAEIRLFRKQFALRLLREIGAVPEAG